MNSKSTESGCSRASRDLPVVPDLVYSLVPAKLIPELVDECGEFGVRWMAIPSGGFNELSQEGQKLADLLLEKSRKHGIRFVGPNGLTVANTANGLCLPFVPSFHAAQGRASQSSPRAAASASCSGTS